MGGFKVVLFKTKIEDGTLATTLEMQTVYAFLQNVQTVSQKLRILQKGVLGRLYAEFEVTLAEYVFILRSLSEIDNRADLVLNVIHALSQDDDDSIPRATQEGNEVAFFADNSLNHLNELYAEGELGEAPDIDEPTQEEALQMIRPAIITYQPDPYPKVPSVVSKHAWISFFLIACRAEYSVSISQVAKHGNDSFSRCILPNDGQRSPTFRNLHAFLVSLEVAQGEENTILPDGSSPLLLANMYAKLEEFAYAAEARAELVLFITRVLNAFREQDGLELRARMASYWHKRTNIDPSTDPDPDWSPGDDGVEKRYLHRNYELDLEPFYMMFTSIHDNLGRKTTVLMHDLVRMDKAMGRHQADQASPWRTTYIADENRYEFIEVILTNSQVMDFRRVQWNSPEFEWQEGLKMRLESVIPKTEQLSKERPEPRILGSFAPRTEEAYIFENNDENCYYRQSRRDGAGSRGANTHAVIGCPVLGPERHLDPIEIFLNSTRAANIRFTRQVRVLPEIVQHQGTFPTKTLIHGSTALFIGFVDKIAAPVELDEGQRALANFVSQEIPTPITIRLRISTKENSFKIIKGCEFSILATSLFEFDHVLGRMLWVHYPLPWF